MSDDNDFGNVFIDDNDPSIQYSSGWVTNHAGLDQALNRTTHCTTHAGSSAFIPFSGSSYEVMSVGFTAEEGGLYQVSFAADGTTAVVTSQPLNDSEVNPQFNYSIAAAAGLSPGNHVLNITNINGTSPNTFCLDYIVVQSRSISGAGRASVGGTLGLILIAAFAMMR